MACNSDEKIVKDANEILKAAKKNISRIRLQGVRENL